MNQRIVARTAPGLAALLALALAGPAPAEDEAPECTHSIESVPTSVRTILAPLYAGKTPESELGAASEALSTLRREADVCRLIAYENPNASPQQGRDAMEWRSLNQWLTRLVNFTGLNAKGHDNVNWRAEYELFAEIYEMEI